MRMVRNQICMASMLLFFLSAIVVGVSPTDAAEKCKKTKYVTFAGGTATGGGYVVISKWAELMSKEIPCVSASATTGSYYANTLSVHQKKFTIGQADPNTLYNTTRGIRKKFKGKETKNLRFINSTNPAYFQIFVPKNSPIKSVREAITKYPLRNLMVISKLSGHFQWIGKIFKAYGSSYDDLKKRGGSLAYVNYANAIGLMKDGQCDMLMIHTTVPSSVIMDIDNTIGIRFLEVEPAVRRKIVKMIPGMAELTIPGGSYRNLPDDFHTFGLYMQHFTHKDVSEDLVYQATKVFWDHEKDFHALAAWGSQIQLKTALIAATIPVHPGAARYYKEVGIKLPEIIDWPW
ncbi:MAG: TAXI family TRAP transporter solute-binding subunit [Deltaproteobacteria bacterium]|nr:TAXI family TRAP transporter solute-binding subunit [Deltaproteobacteria bacterium]